jgi:hypothetical protein
MVTTVLRTGFNVTLPGTLPLFLFPVSHTVFDTHINVISFTPKRKVRHSQRRFSLNSRPQTTDRAQFLTDPKRMKKVENTGNILFSALIYYIYCTDIHEVRCMTFMW